MNLQTWPRFSTRSQLASAFPLPLLSPLLFAAPSTCLLTSSLCGVKEWRCPQRLLFSRITHTPRGHPSTAPHFVGSSSRVIQQPVKDAEQRELEKQGFHPQVMGQPVQHLGNTVVGVSAVLPVAPQQKHVGLHNG